MDYLNKKRYIDKNIEDVVENDKDDYYNYHENEHLNKRLNN